MRSNRDTFDSATLRRYAVLFEYHCYGFLVFVRKHFTEPADATRRRKNSAEDSDRYVGKKTGEH